jgi:predicted dehydrogenase
VRYAGGALGSLIGSSDVRGSTEQALGLWGEEGRIILEPAPRVYSLRPLSGLRTTRWHSFGRLPAAPIRAVYLSRVGTAIAEGRPPEITAQDGVAVQAIIEAIYRSAAEDTAIDPRRLVDAQAQVTAA